MLVAKVGICGLIAADVAVTAADNAGYYLVADLDAVLRCKSLVDLTLNPNGTSMGEGAFSYCEKLTQVENLCNCPVILSG